MAIQQKPCTWPRPVGCGDWASGLPTLAGDRVSLREVRGGDAASLVRYLTAPPVARFIAPAPPTTAGFARFIRWSHAQRRKGTHLSFGIVPANSGTAVGVIQFWAVEADFATAEWGFALGEPFWGTGLFVEAARLALNFAFETLHVKRLEARSVDRNNRGNGILRKLGATPEGTLRNGFRSGGSVRNHVMWSLLAEEWRAGSISGVFAPRPALGTIDGGGSRLSLATAEGDAAELCAAGCR